MNFRKFSKLFEKKKKNLKIFEFLKKNQISGCRIIGKYYTNDKKNYAILSKIFEILKKKTKKKTFLYGGQI